jgi:hypothetical protein
MNTPPGDAATAPSQPLDYVSPHRDRVPRWLAGRVARWHAITVLVLFACFAGLVFFGVRDRPPRIVAMLAGYVVVGPMAGAILADYQRCCLDFSLSLVPYCVGALATATAVQLLVPPRGLFTRSVRVTTWLLGVFTWFGGAIVSYLHAMS